MSGQSPPSGPPQAPAPGSLRCPRCSATVGPDQDWCLECGAPARTRLAQTPNWQLPTVALGAMILIAGALFAFAFVKLTDDAGVPAATAPATVTTASPVAPPAVVTPPAVTTPPAATTRTTTTPPTTQTTPTTTPTTAPVPPAEPVPGRTTITRPERRPSPATTTPRSDPRLTP